MSDHAPGSTSECKRVESFILTAQENNRNSYLRDITSSYLRDITISSLSNNFCFNDSSRPYGLRRHITQARRGRQLPMNNYRI